MKSDIIGGKTYRPIGRCVRAIQFLGGEESAKEVNVFLESSAGLSTEWKPAQGPRQDAFGLFRPGSEEQLTISVHGISSKMVMNIGDYVVFEDDESFGVLPKFTFEDQYEEVSE